MTPYPTKRRRIRTITLSLLCAAAFSPTLAANAGDAPTDRPDSSGTTDSGGLGGEQGLSAPGGTSGQTLPDSATGNSGSRQGSVEDSGGNHGANRASDDHAPTGDSHDE